MRTTKFKYKVIWKDNTESILEITAESIMDGHYKIYRKYGKIYEKAHYIK